MSGDVKDSKAGMGAKVQKSLDKQVSRRGFLKGAIITGVAATATGVMIKKTVDVVAESGARGEYSQLLEGGEKALSAREYVVMTKDEKDGLVRMLVEGYKYDIA